MRRAARLLLESARDGGVSAREAAERHGFSLPTGYHLLNSLASEGLLAKDRHGRYVLGPAAGVIAEAVHRDVRVPERYTAALRALVRETGETAYLSAWGRGELRILAVEEGSHMVRVTGLAVDYASNPHARTSARVLLACATPAVRQAHLADMRLRRLTPATITSRERLEQDLHRIAVEGIAIGRDEYVVGLTCASVAVVENGVATAALTIAAPTDRFRSTEPALTAALRVAGSRAAHGITPA